MKYKELISQGSHAKYNKNQSSKSTISLLVALYFAQLRNMLNLNHLNDQHPIALTCGQWELTQFPSPKPFFFLSKPLIEIWEYINFLYLCEFSLQSTTQDPMSASQGHQPLPQQHLRWACPHLSCTHRLAWSWLPSLTLALHRSYGLIGVEAAPAAPLATLFLCWWWVGGDPGCSTLPDPIWVPSHPSTRELSALVICWHWLKFNSIREI